MKGEKDTELNPALFADDPDWASCVPEIMSGGRKCGMPDHEDCSPLDVDGVAGNLMPGGALGAMKGYEARPGQIDMLKAVAACYAQYHSRIDRICLKLFFHYGIHGLKLLNRIKAHVILIV